LTRFVASALDASHANPFLTDVAAFVARIARLAAINSLAQTALKLTSPGVPDIYQGCELWDFSPGPIRTIAVPWISRRAAACWRRCAPASAEPRAGALER